MKVCVWLFFCVLCPMATTLVGQKYQLPAQLVIIMYLYILIRMFQQKMLIIVDRAVFICGITYAIYAFITILWSPTIYRGFQNISVAILLPLAGISLTAQKINIKQIDLMVCAVCVANALIMTYVYTMGYDEYIGEGFGRLRGLLFTWNIALCYMVPRSIAVDSIRMKLFALIMILGALAFGFITGARFSIAMTVLTLIFSVLNREASIFRVVLILIIGGLLFAWLGENIRSIPYLGERFTQGEMQEVAGVNINFTGRVLLWTLALDHWAENLGSVIWGWGAGSVSIIYGYSTAMVLPHNEYIRILHDGGIVGLALFFSYILAIAARFSRERKLLFGRLARQKDTRKVKSFYVAELGVYILVLLEAMVDNPFVYSSITIMTVVLFSLARSKVIVTNGVAVQ